MIRIRIFKRNWIYQISSTVLIYLLYNAYGFKYVIEVDGEKIKIDSDSNEVNVNKPGTGLEKEAKRAHDSVGIPYIEQIPPKSIEEEFSKLESMITLLEKDLDQYNQTRQTPVKEQISFKELVDKLKHLQTTIDAIQEKENSEELA